MFSRGRIANKQWFIFFSFNKKSQQVHADVKYMQICTHVNVVSEKADVELFQLIGGCLVLF